MAKVHYAAKVTDWLQKKNVNFVPYDNNAPNIPQARPIEKFWALCKQEYKRLQYPIEDLEEFEKTWKKIAIQIQKKNAQRLMSGIRGKIRSIGYYGVYSILNS